MNLAGEPTDQNRGSLLDEPLTIGNMEGIDEESERTERFDDRCSINFADCDLFSHWNSGSVLSVQENRAGVV